MYHLIFSLLLYPLVGIFVFHFIKGYYSPKRYLLGLKNLFGERKSILFIITLISVLSIFDAEFCSFLCYGLALILYFLIPKTFFKLHRKGWMLLITSILFYGASSFLYPRIYLLRIFFVLISPYLAYLFLYPIERSISLHYIHLAKKKIERMNTKIIGITGSFGKTTMKNYLFYALKRKAYVLASPKNVNTYMGLCKFINEKVDENLDYLILEMGIDEKNGMDHFKKFIQLDSAFIVGVGPMHLSTFHTLENVCRAKSKIQNLLKENGELFVEENAISFVKEYIHVPFHIYSEKEVLDKKIPRLKRIAISGVQCFLNCYKIGKLPIDYLKTIPTIERRFEIKKESEILLINDSYNINPIGAKEAIHYLLKTKGIHIVITGGLLELGNLYQKENEKLGQELKDVDYLFLVTKKRNHPLKKGYLAAKGNNIVVIKSLKEAIFKAKSIPGEKAILLLAKGDDFYIK